MKKFSEMTKIGLKRTMTKVHKTDSLVKEISLMLQCKPEDVVERLQHLLGDIEETKSEIQKLKDQL